MTAQKPPPGLYGILARKAPCGVIIRRGPTKWCRLSLWHTDTDTFEHGQWFKGKIIPPRCDLSPDGRLLIYFATKYTGYTLSRDTPYATSWIAISKPPYLTALALWNIGSTYGVGGLFKDNRTVQLPFYPRHFDTHPNHSLKGSKLRLTTAPPVPMHFYRMERDGWLRQADDDASSDKIHPLSQSRISWHKYAPASPFYLILERRVVGYHVTFTYLIANDDAQTLVALDNFTWVDWDQRGRLVGAQAGRILALNPENPQHDQQLLADFADQEPDPQPAPRWARRW
jgi:hypothetical protein